MPYQSFLNQRRAIKYWQQICWENGTREDEFLGQGGVLLHLVGGTYSVR